MHSEKDTIFFTNLKNKLNELEEGNASEQDWVDFAKRYQSRSRTQSRKRYLLWFIPALLIVAVMAIIPVSERYKRLSTNTHQPLVITTEATASKPNARQKEATGITVNSSSEAKKSGKSRQLRQRSGLTDTPANRDYNRKNSVKPTATIPSNVYEEKSSTLKSLLASGQRFKRNLYVAPATQPKIEHSSAISPLTELSTDYVLRKPEHTTKNEKPDTHPEGTIPDFNHPSTSVASAEIDRKMIHDTASKSDSSFARKVTEPDAKAGITTPHPPKYFLELNGVGYTSYSARKPYPSDRMYTGMGINLGYSLTSKLNLVVGINYAVMNEVNVVILKQEHSMDEIIRIDTSLKFSAVDNRIGMKIDTVTTTNRFTSEDNLKLNTDKQLLAIPFCIQLHTSLRKVGLSIHAGATTFIFREITTILTNAGKPNEERTSESSNKLILAPTFGIGVHKNVYKSLDLHSSLSYQYLFSDQFANRNIFQFQAGLRYHF